jgi:IclR family KDG regulon transcriptional repressor
MASDRNQFIASAAATMEVLEVLADASTPLPLKGIAERTSRPKGSVHRMLATLVNTGYVVQEPKTGRYALSLKLWRIGCAALRDLDVVRVAQQRMERLVAATDETVHLGVLDPSGGVLYVSKVESPRSIRVQTRVGQIGPSWCTATGRSLLAFHPEVAELVLAKPLQARTPKTVVDPRKIRALLRDVAARGYAVTRAENHPEMGGVAAPVRDYTGSVVASCGVAIPVFRMDHTLVERCVPEVVRAAAEISEDLGWRKSSERGVRYGT